MARVLVVEDDYTIGSVLSSSLTASGYEVQWSQDGQGALDVAGSQGIDLILLDLGLPDLDGVDLCRDLRVLLPATVIVILTARHDEMDVVSGLDAGADDYLNKPFKITEVLARLRAHLRRADSPAASHGVLSVGALTVDPSSRRAFVADVEVVLRARELELLLRLARDAGSAVSRESLMSDVWDENWFGSTKTLDVHMVSLRRKLGDAVAAAGIGEVEQPRISTLRGHGYRLERADRAGSGPAG